MNLIVLYKDSTLRDHDSRRVLVFDLNTQKQFGDSIITDEHYRGRFRSDLFLLIDGHIYFNNEVYKVRYDIMKETRSQNISQGQFIDPYNEILDLTPSESVRSDTPMISIANHRQLYIINNQRQQ